MQHLVNKICIFFLPLLALFIGFEILLRQIPNDYDLKRTYLEKEGKNVEILILGSSHTYYGVNPVYLSRKAFNAAYISQDLIYDQLIFEKFADRLPKLRYLIVPISYFTMTYTIKSSLEDWRIKNYIIYYGLLSFSQVSKYFEILSFPWIDNRARLLSYYRRGISSITSSSLGWGSNYTSDYNADIEAEGRSASKRHTENKLEDVRSKTLKVQESLDKLLTETAQRKIKVLLITPPAYESYVKHLKPTQLELMYSTISTFQKKYPHVSYIDFLKDPDFTRKDFFDSHHVNEIGAEKLTKKINHALDNLP
jgi:hypothetical protein